MIKKIILTALVIGIALIIASVVMTVVPASGANIIGGACWPTLMLYFHTTGADWLAFIGVAVTAAAAVLLAWRKK